MSRLRIVLGGGFLAKYMEGGGHWAAFLQYVLGLRALGHDVVWLEVLRSSGDPACDRGRLAAFFRRMEDYGVGGRSAVLLHGTDVAEPSLETSEAHGLSLRQIEDVARSADLVWNFSAALGRPLLSLFRHRVLVDLDPGHLQVSALTWNLGLDAHDAFLTVGTNVHGAGCDVPTLGVSWRPFLPVVHLPMWSVTADPGATAPFTSVTQWTWEQVSLGTRVLSVSKRDAYLASASLPRRTGRAFELAVNLDPDDVSGDRERLLADGWRLVDPHDVAASPSEYQRYLAASRAEFACPKPIHRALRTGWFSDRSACYLASGRPVLFEDTAVGERLPAGSGLLLFRGGEEAVAGVAEIDGDWARHSRAARALAEEFLDARRCLPAMLEASATRTTRTTRVRA
jgi:hypothetical protein